MVVHFTYRYKLKSMSYKYKSKIDDSDTAKVDEMNIINSDYNVVSDIDAVSWLRLIFPFCLVQSQTENIMFVTLNL